MTREAILALSGLALRKAVGSIVMEWVTISTVEFAAGENTSTEVISWRDSSRIPVSLPHFERSLDAARLVEDEVERRGPRCVDDFCFALEEILPKGEHFYHRYWRPLRATPDQICKAALIAATEGL